MVKAGFAQVYRGEHAEGFDLTRYFEAEKKSRGERKGMWVQGEKHVRPSDWRRVQRSE
jgi:micrococcal nuclease